MIYSYLTLFLQFHIYTCVYIYIAAYAFFVQLEL